MATTAVSVTGRVVVAGLLCAVLAACGTTRAGQGAPPAAVPTLAPEKCGTAQPNPPTDQETGAPPGPPTDQDTGASPGPPTDQDTGAPPGPPTDQDTGAPPGPPTDQDTGAPAGPPTDGEITNGGGPCGSEGWFDMTREFTDYLAGHLTKGDDGAAATDTVTETRVRKVNAVGEARITFFTRAVGKSRGDDARRFGELFTAWRREVYGDTGTVTIRTSDGAVVVTESW